MYHIAFQHLPNFVDSKRIMDNNNNNNNNLTKRSTSTRSLLALYIIGCSRLRSVTVGCNRLFQEASKFRFTTPTSYRFALLQILRDTKWLTSVIGDFESRRLLIVRQLCVLFPQARLAQPLASLKDETNIPLRSRTMSSEEL